MIRFLAPMFLAPVSLVALTACSGGFDFRDLRNLPTVAPAVPATPAAIAPATPQPPVLTAKERLVSAIENNGCALTTDNVGTILTAATISQDELVRLAEELAGEGRAVVSGSGAVQVVTPRCSQTTT